MFADALTLSAGWWVSGGLAALLLLAVCAGFVAGVWCAPVFQEWGLKRASRHIQRVSELTAKQLDDAQRLCRMLGEFTSQELTATQWDRLERSQSRLVDAWQLVAERQRPNHPATKETAVAPPTPFRVDWQRGGVDGVTQLPDRKTFDANLDLLLAGSRLHTQPSGLLLVRMDKCDQLQKRYGSDAVGKLLSKVATLIVKTVRDDDLVCRMQPDVIAVLLPSLSPIAGARIAEAVRTTIRDHHFHTEENGPEVLVTASLGYACALPTEPATVILDRAQDALNRSQTAGRNQLHVHDAAQRTAVRVG